MHKRPQTNTHKTDAYSVCAHTHPLKHKAGLVYGVAIKGNAVRNESSVSYSFFLGCVFLEMKKWIRPESYVYRRNFYLSLIFQLCRWESVRPDPSLTSSLPFSLQSLPTSLCFCITENSSEDHTIYMYVSVF